jgi:hypothetical protein
LQGYFPERLGFLIMLDAPSAFGMVWKVVSPFVHQNTRDKVIMQFSCRHSFFDGLSRSTFLIENANLPVFPVLFQAASIPGIFKTTHMEVGREGKRKVSKQKKGCVLGAVLGRMQRVIR